MRVARRSMRPTSLLDGATRLKDTSDVAHLVWPVATQHGKLTGRRLVIAFVPRRVGNWRNAANTLVPLLKRALNAG